MYYVDIVHFMYYTYLNCTYTVHKFTEDNMDEIIISDCIENVEAMTHLINVFMALDNELAKLERRRHNHNFGKRLELYHTKVNEEIEKIKAMNLPPQDFNKQVLLIYDYYKIFGNINPLTSISIAKRELSLLTDYLNSTSKVLHEYMALIKEK